MAFPLGLDYSQGWPNGAAVKAAGYQFVVRYLVNGLAGRTDLSFTEVASMQAAGVDIALVWERKIIGQPDRATQGRPAGTADAQAALTAAQNLGLAGRVIYFAIDFDIPDYAPGNPDARAKLGQVAAYFDGVLSVLPLARVGVYGGFYAVKRILDAGLATYAWQTAAWSGGQEDPRINLFQRVGTATVAGVGCDVNEARKPDFGQHPEDDVDPKDIWGYPLDNPNYSETADPASGEGKKTFPASDYLVVADMAAQEAKANSAAAVAGVQDVSKQIAAMAQSIAVLSDQVKALTAALAAAGTAGTLTVTGELTLSGKQG